MLKMWLKILYLPFIACIYLYLFFRGNKSFVATAEIFTLFEWRADIMKLLYSNVVLLDWHTFNHFFR